MYCEPTHKPTLAALIGAVSIVLLPLAFPLNVRAQEGAPAYTHPLNPQARMPQQGFGGRLKSALAGILVDRRAGLERNESRGIMTHEWFHYLILPTLGDAVAAYRGKTMIEVARDNHLDEAWLEYNRAHGGTLQPAAVSAR